MLVAYVAMLPLKTASLLATLGRPLDNAPTRQAAVGGHWSRARRRTLSGSRRWRLAARPPRRWRPPGRQLNKDVSGAVVVSPPRVR